MSGAKRAGGGTKETFDSSFEPFVVGAGQAHCPRCGVATGNPILHFVREHMEGIEYGNQREASRKAREEDSE